jgi:hypothetical protein
MDHAPGDGRRAANIVLRCGAGVEPPR